MVEILHEIGSSPVLAFVGAALLLALLLLPVALKLAGLSGQQIVDTLTITGRILIDLVKAFRDENRSDKS